MSNIDWSTAPTWATKHGIIGTYREYPIWFNDTQYTYCDEQQEGRVFKFSDGCVYKPKKIYAITERPAPQWSAEGLPPVGIYCEAHRGEWGYATCVAHHDGGAVMAMHEDDLSYSYIWCSARGVRPIRTPEQIAGEEREAFARNLVIEMGKDPEAFPNSVNQALKIYDLGYRKGDAK